MKLLSLLMICFMLPLSAHAGSPEASKAFIADMGSEAVSFLKDETLSMEKKKQKFRSLLNNKFDMKTIGRFALGRYWNTATPAQQKEYLKLFNDLVVKVYSSRFEQYDGQSFEVRSAKATGKKDMLVGSDIVPPNGSKVRVDWRIRDKGGNLKVIDVIIEGVSMGLTQRSDFASVIQRGGGDIEVLLQHLRK